MNIALVDDSAADRNSLKLYLHVYLKKITASPQNWKNSPVLKNIWKPHSTGLSMWFFWTSI